MPVTPSQPSPIEPPSVLKTNDTELKSLIEQNIKWSQVIFDQNKKIQRRLTWMAVGSYARLLLILIPLIAAIIFLPPLMRDVVAEYQSLLGNFGQGSSTSTMNFSGVNIEELLKQFQK